MSGLVITTVNCKKDDNKVSSPTPPQKEISLQTSTTLGKCLVDGQNRTLYFFSNDPNGQDSCTGGCLALWPIFNVDNRTADKIGDGLTISDSGSVTSVSGKKQVTYKGWPLYYYAPLVNGTNTQEAPGQTLGEGIGNIWFVAKPDYSIVTLYTFKLDSSNRNKFTKPDFSNNNVWPIYETDKIIVPSTVDKTKFGSIDVFGRTQLTYNGWPLYYFGQDGQTRGFNKGISFPNPGVWPVPVPDISQAPR
jgi:predicted lipoprotein with Yx(FWY)xxD motif